MSQIAQKQIIDLLYKTARTNFNVFVHTLQRKIEPNWNYNNKFFTVVIDNLNDFFNNPRMDLLIEEAPPRTGKTELTSMFGGAYLLGKNNNKRFMFCCGNQAVKRKIRKGLARIIKSNAYKQIFFDIKIVIDNENELMLNNGNLALFSTTGSEVPTGEGFHFIVLEDFLTYTVIKSEAKLENAFEQLDGLLSRTQDDPSTKLIVNNQRLSSNDLSARLIKSYDSMGLNYTRLTFPYFFETETIYTINNKQIIFNQNEYLVDRFDEDKKNNILAKLGSHIFETQYQQNPHDYPEGALWSQEMIDKAKNHPYNDMSIDEIRNKMRMVTIGVDPASTYSKDSDLTGIVVCGFDGLEYYVLDDFSGKYSPDMWAKKIEDLWIKWSANIVIAEGNQGGEMVRHTLMGIPTYMKIDIVHARFNKQTRAEPVVAKYERGLVKHLAFYKGEKYSYNRLYELEKQLMYFDPAVSTKSPDRLDALVYAMYGLPGAKATKKGELMIFKM